jgi:hypothetical protein
MWGTHKRPRSHAASPLLPAAVQEGDSGCDAASSRSANSTYVTAPSVLTPVPESPAGTEQNENAAATSTAKSGGRQGAEAVAPANRWRRKNAAERQEGERRQHLAELRAYFQEASRGRCSRHEQAGSAMSGQ